MAYSENHDHLRAAGMVASQNSDTPMFSLKPDPPPAENH
jgi:hypothetical protein